MSLIKNKDYYIIGCLGKHQREPIRQWLKDNNILPPEVPEDELTARDCISRENYKAWIVTQQWPNGYPIINP